MQFATAYYFRDLGNTPSIIAIACWLGAHYMQSLMHLGGVSRMIEHLLGLYASPWPDAFKWETLGGK